MGKKVDLTLVHSRPGCYKKVTRSESTVQRILINHIFQPKHPRDTRAIDLAVHRLSHQAGDSLIVQDLKSIAIRRAVLETYSRSWVRLADVNTSVRGKRKPFALMAERLFELLKNFPPVPFLDEQIEQDSSCCRIEGGEGSELLRAKREGMLFYLTKVIVTSLTNQGVILDVFSREMFNDLYGSDIKILRAHAECPMTPQPIAEALKKQVLNSETGLPFNIDLQD